MAFFKLELIIQMNINVIIKILIIFSIFLNTVSYADTGHRINKSSTNHTDFQINPEICQDNQGPDCEKLRLGDNYISTTSPDVGFMYSCNTPNANAPGSTGSEITWIDFKNNSWNLLEKLWLPAAELGSEKGIYNEHRYGDNTLIEINNLPVDSKIGDWPMSDYTMLNNIDKNPGMPKSKNMSFVITSNPEIAKQPTCLPLGAIGVTKNGVVIYNAADARGEDAVAREIVDKFGGHPAKDEYHYHFIPERLDNKFLVNGHSNIIGYINDGFAIYGYKGVGGVEMSNSDLDICHGHKHDNLRYHYHATIEYPYTVGCYKGEINNF